MLDPCPVCACWRRTGFSLPERFIDSTGEFDAPQDQHAGIPGRVPRDGLIGAVRLLESRSAQAKLAHRLVRSRALGPGRSRESVIEE